MAIGLLLAGLLFSTHPVVAQAARLITGADVKDGSLTSADVANRSLLAKDFKDGQLPAGPAGPTGPVGPPGPQGPQGAAGSALGYGWVLSTPSDGVQVVRAKGLTEDMVEHPTPKLWCFHDLPWAVEHVQVTSTTSSPTWVDTSDVDCTSDESWVVRSLADGGSFLISFN